MTEVAPEFAFHGIHHMALVSSDMARTVEFYENVLGMPLTKTVELPGGGGQHFFFDCGNGDHVAYFWFPDSPPGVPGISQPIDLIGEGNFITALGSMNHLAFRVNPEDFDDYCEKLRAKGIRTSRVWNHDDSETTVADELHPGVFIRSMYFFDPDGILLEFACWHRALTPEDVRHTGARAVELAGA